jgi:Zn-finger nucleic acid-binding protein
MSVCCPECGHALPAAFPGANVTCVCGRSVTLERAATVARASSAPRGGGPYRAAVTNVEERVTTCPYCGNGCPPLVRICPHCDVRLDNVRCTRCFSLQGPGSFACVRCGQALELEPLLDATDAPCPRCTSEGTRPGSTLEVSGALEGRVHECPRCGGMFIGRDVLAEILCRAELTGPLDGETLRRKSALGEVHYVSCPLCHNSMNRVNFGKVSGVIVDVCRDHGTWFDAGELTTVVAFAAAGGLAKTRAREASEQKDLRAQSAAVHSELMTLGVRDDERLSLWQDFLSAILYW